MGTQHRVGTTTIAMQFAVYLKSIGANVSYVEANDSWHLKLIAEHYNMKKSGDGYCYKGIAFEELNSKNETVFDLIVYDLSILDNKTKKEFANCNIRILCAGKKAYELPFYKKGLESLGDIEYNTIVNIHTHNNKDERVYTAMLYNDIFNERANKEIFIDITKNYSQILRYSNNISDPSVIEVE